MEVWFWHRLQETVDALSREIVIAAENQVISGTNYLGFCFAVSLGLKRACGTGGGGAG